MNTERIKEYLNSEDIETVCIGIELLRNSCYTYKQMKKMFEQIFLKDKRVFYNDGYSVNQPAGVYFTNKYSKYELDENRPGVYSYYKYLGEL